MPVQNTESGSRFRSKRALSMLGATALALPLLMIPTAAQAESFAPADAVEAITSGTLLPDFEQEYLAQVNSSATWDHNVALSVDIGPRIAGAASEDAAIEYVGGLLEEYGYETEVETFEARAQQFADVVPSRYTDEYASWQFRPAANAVMTGPDNPVSGNVVDFGAADAATDFGDLSGQVALVDWIAGTADRDALLTALGASGPAAIVLAQTSGAESLPNPRNVPVEVTDTVVVAAATNQGERIRTLLEDGPLSLSITTEQGRADSSNIIGVLPPASGRDDAPIVYIGAHIDSVVGSPGASDNATGVSIMLEVARIIGQYDFDVEVRIGGWGAEEIGIIGSRHHAQSLTDDEVERTIGAWNMDMAGTSFEGRPGQPVEFWALSGDGATADENRVLGYANQFSQAAGHGDLNIGYVGRSDHQSFHDVGIDAAVFSWMFWSAETSIVLEPTYHGTHDTLEFVSEERMGLAAEVLGGSVFRAAMNQVDVTVTDETGEPAVGTQVAMSCAGDDGWRDAGVTGAEGAVVTYVPRVDCDFVAMAENGARASATADAGDTAVSLALQFDDEAPTVSLSADSAAGATGWHTSAPVNVTVAAEDNADDAPVVEYSLDGEEWMVYSESIALTDDGSHSVYARASDDFGNVSETVVELFLIDTVAPTLTVTADADNRGNVTIAATDETSGVGMVEYRMVGSDEWIAVEGEMVDGSLTATLEIGDAAAEAEFRVTDVAGNVSETATVAWDVVAPAPVDEGPGAPGTGGTLPTTGGELNVLAISLLALLLAGAGALVLVRVRAARATDSI